MSATIKLQPEDARHLKHMLGCTERLVSQWGYRNYFDCGEKDIESMRRLEAAGLVVCRERDGLTLFFATETGAMFAGVPAKNIAKMKQEGYLPKDPQSGDEVTP